MLVSAKMTGRRLHSLRVTFVCATLGTLAGPACRHQEAATVVPSRPSRYVADLSNSIGTTSRLPLRGRVIEEDEDFDPRRTTPFSQMSQDELDNEKVTVILGTTPPVELGSFITNEEGYVDTALDIGAFKLAPGPYTLHFVVRGKSARSRRAYLFDPRPTQTPKIVVRSDVDMTYLDTDFVSSSAKLRLLIERAADRAVLPAMPEVYRGLRAGGASVPLTFISGSPRFFKMVLESRMELDGIEQDGAALKPFKDIIADRIWDVDPAGVVPALEEQVGYKLRVLLELRLDVPQDTREILMGDDTEADAVVYALYHRLLAGDLDVPGLLTALDAVGVARLWRDQIGPLAAVVTARVPASSAPLVIYINRTRTPGRRFDVAEWTIPGVTRCHSGAWPLILDLFEEGRVSATTVQATRTALLTAGQSADDLKAAARAAASDGFIAADTLLAFE